MELISVR